MQIISQATIAKFLSNVNEHTTQNLNIFTEILIDYFMPHHFTFMNCGKYLEGKNELRS